MQVRSMTAGALAMAALCLGVSYRVPPPDTHDGVADVKQFGAVGDGVADDTEAIQKAIDSAQGNVQFPKGRYRISRSLVVDLDKTGFTSLHGQGVAEVIMAGPGPAIKLVGTHFRSADPGGFDDKVWRQQRMPLVDGLGITGEHPEAVGIEAVGTMQWTATRLHLRKLLHGIHLTGNNRNVTISDCHIYENHGVGIYYDDVNLHQSNITACHISYNEGGGIVSRAGNVRNIHITGCDIESNMSPDTPATANVLIDASGSLFRRHVAGCADDGPGHGHARRPFGPLGQTKVGYQRVVVMVEQDVGRLQVTVQDPLLMSELDRAGDRLDGLGRTLGR